VPPIQQLDVLYRSPRQVFDAFSGNARLVQAKVRHYWGKIEEQGIASGARALWQVGDLRNVPPYQPRYIIQAPDAAGRKGEFTAIAKNDAMVSVSLTLYGEVGGASVDIFDLWTLYTLAAADVLKIEAMYSMTGAVVPREGVSVATDQIRGQLSFRIPIVDLQPHARAAADNVSLES
jgi:hypothetical protein